MSEIIDKYILDNKNQEGDILAGLNYFGVDKLESIILEALNSGKKLEFYDSDNEDEYDTLNYRLV